MFTLKNLLKLAWQSIKNRKATALLVVFSMTLSITLLLSIERLRTDIKDNFTNTISGTDLIVGARGGDIQLLLYSIFHIGNASNNISFKSYQNISNSPYVQWTIPISLGDSHQGYRVIGTNNNFFEHYQFAKQKSLNFEHGTKLSQLYDAVVGYQVAQSLNYKIDDNIVLSHGVSVAATHPSLANVHDNSPFSIVGILQPTGTPIDKAVFVSVEAIEAIHSNPNEIISDDISQIEPKSITAFLVALKSKSTIFQIQRFINQFKQEPLTSIIPGLTLHKLWQSLAMIEKALLLISSLVFITSLIGMIAVSIAGLGERRREIAILRSVGAKPRHILFLLMLESILLAVIATILALLLFYGILFGLEYWSSYSAKIGIHLSATMLSSKELIILIFIIATSAILSLFAGIRAYNYSLADGFDVKL